MKKKKRLSASEWLLKQSKRHKRFNFSYTLIVLIVALVLLVFAIRAVKLSQSRQCQAQVMIIFVVHI